MKLSPFVAAALASTASARIFWLHEHAGWKGAEHEESRPDDSRCWNLNGKGDTASSVSTTRPDARFGCTTFYRERDCRGANWVQTDSAATVPGFLNDHIWSFRNSC